MFPPMFPSRESSNNLLRRQLPGSPPIFLYISKVLLTCMITENAVGDWWDVL